MNHLPTISNDSRLSSAIVISIFAVILGVSFFGLEPAHSADTSSYFPEVELTKLEQDWLGLPLARMDEPILRPDDYGDSDFVFRVMTLPSFSNPLLVRIDDSNGSPVLRGVRLSGRGGYDPGEIEYDTTIKITDHKLNELKQRLMETGFRQLSDTDAVRGLDGTELIIQVIREGELRFFRRWHPPHEKEQRRLENLITLYECLFEETGVYKNEK